LIIEESNIYQGKKLLANGMESLALSDIYSQLKQTYTSSEKNVVNKNELMQTLVNNMQLFFHGNTHTTNFKLMLNFLEAKSPQFDDYESASGLIGDTSLSFKDYYAEKAKKDDDRFSEVEEGEEPEDFRTPALQNYYKISLDWLNFIKLNRKLLYLFITNKFLKVWFKKNKKYLKKICKFDF